jgi:hypothetical protein
MNLMRTLGIIAIVIIMIYYVSDHPWIIVVIIALWLLYELAGMVYDDGVERGKW